jgi:hypothetical protein
MALPWLRLLDAVVGVTNLVRRSGANDRARKGLVLGSGALGQLEARLAAVVVAALREAFDRDSRRLELEREQMERAERARTLELLRQAGEREIGRLRLLAGAAGAGWLGTLVLAVRLSGPGVGVRVALGIGWALLLGALAASLAAQGAVNRAIERSSEQNRPSSVLDPTAAGMLAPWLLILGLAAAGLAMLI